MIKPHIYTSEEAFTRHTDVRCLCGEIVKNAVEQYGWNDEVRPDYSEFVSAFGTCGHCEDILKSTEFEKPHYIVGVVPAQEAFDAERRFEQVSKEAFGMREQG